MKTFRVILVNLLLLVLGAVITYLSADYVPVGGPDLQRVYFCGEPSGLPFSFIGTWKHWPRGPGFPLPACAGYVDYLAATIDVLFWFAVLHIARYLFAQYRLRMQNKQHA